MTVTVTVKLFARARDLAGTGSVTLELPESSCIRDLRTALCERCPDLRPIAASLLVSVGNDYAGDDVAIRPNEEIACFPPVSGG